MVSEDRQSQDSSGVQVVRSVCEGSHCECGVLVYVKDGRIIKIEGNHDYPMNEGTLCPKGLAYHQLAYHPDRLKYPLRRVGERGEGKWQRISWNEALGTIADRFKEIIDKYGPNAIGYTIQDGPKPFSAPFFFLLRAMGSPNVFGAGYICYMPSFEAGIATCGNLVDHERGPEYEDTKCVLVWGANPVNTHPMLARKMLQAQQQGANLIVVDPRFTPFASKADLWLQVRPATDCALAMGMLHVVITEGLYDQKYVDEWCYGFEELKERIKEYPPQKVSEITWVPEQDIIEAARMYATAKPAVEYHRVALEQIGTTSFQACRAIQILVAITGNVDIKGGNTFGCMPKGLKIENTMWREAREQSPWVREEEQLGAREFPLFVGPRAHVGWAPTWFVMNAIHTGKPYPLKGLFGVANFVTNSENPRSLVEALKKLEFSWMTDFFMTPTLEYMDIVLPAATWLEQDDIAEISYNNYFGIRRKAIEPVGECKDEKWVAIELAKRMGLLNRFYSHASTVEEFLDFRVAGMGVTFEQLRQGDKDYIVRPQEYEKFKRKGGFHTNTGKLELYSTACEKLGLEPLPYYEEPYESHITTPELAEEYPLIGVWGNRHIAYLHSSNRQVPWLRELHPEPRIEIHPETAKELGVADGDMVWIETPRGGEKKVKQRAVLTAAVHPRVVCAEPFWWFPEKQGPDYGCWESNINIVASNDPPCDPVVGSTLLRGGLCRIYKAEE